MRHVGVVDEIVAGLAVDFYSTSIVVDVIGIVGIGDVRAGSEVIDGCNDARAVRDVGFRSARADMNEFVFCVFDFDAVAGIEIECQTVRCRNVAYRDAAQDNLVVVGVLNESVIAVAVEVIDVVVIVAAVGINDVVARAAGDVARTDNGIIACIAIEIVGTVDVIVAVAAVNFVVVACETDVIIARIAVDFGIIR